MLAPRPYSLFLQILKQKHFRQTFLVAKTRTRFQCGWVLGAGFGAVVLALEHEDASGLCARPAAGEEISYRLGATWELRHQQLEPPQPAVFAALAAAQGFVMRIGFFNGVCGPLWPRHQIQIWGA